MNDRRSGDIVVIMDGRKGYLALDNENDSFPGWHGGPTVSESYVPLMVAMPGEAFVALSGGQATPIDIPPALETGAAAVATLKDEEGYLRNWHLAPLLQGIHSAFRAQQ